MITLFLRLVTILVGAFLYAHLYKLLQVALYLLMPIGSFYFVLMLVTSFVSGLLVELAPFNRRVHLKKWEAALPVAIFVGLIVLTNPYWWTGLRFVDYFHGVSVIAALPLVSTLLGILLAKALLQETGSSSIRTVVL